jgi:hypothetical protein
MLLTFLLNVAAHFLFTLLTGLYMLLDLIVTVGVAAAIIILAIAVLGAWLR